MANMEASDLGTNEFDTEHSVRVRVPAIDDGRYGLA
jgi:hypothetical protein